jgi:hypothetical protein
MRHLIVIGIGLFFSVPSFAGETCRDIYVHCSTVIDTTCLQTLAGVMETKSEKICPPSTFTWAGVSGIVIHWIDAHPKSMGDQAWGCVTRAFEDAWRCGRPSGQ